MPLTGKLLADFSSFSDAIAKAEVQLKGFESGAGKVQTALSRMTDSYSGRKVIADTTLMVKAVQDLGGVTALTANEQAKYNAQITEGIAKMEALGKTAPAVWKDLQTQTQTTTSLFSQVESALGPIGAAVVGAFSVGAITAFAQELVGSMAHLYDLHLATGISTTDLQKLTYVGAEFGLGIDEMGRGVEQLSAKLANGDKNAARAVGMLGLNMKQLLSEGPKDAFLDIADAVGRVEDPMAKMGLATELFGGKLAKVLLPALADLRTKMNEVPKDAIISADNIEKAHDFEVGLDHLIIRLKAATVGFIDFAAASVLPLFGRGQPPAAPFDPASFKPAISHAASGGLSPDETSQVLNNAKLLTNELTRLRTEALEPLTAAQQRNILELKKWGESEADTAKLVGSNEIAVHLFIKAHDEAAAAAKKLKEENDRVFASLQKTESAIGFNVHGLADLSRMGGEVTNHIETFNQEIERLQRAGQFSGAALVKLRDAIATLPNVTSSSVAAIDEVRGATDKWMSSFAKFPQLITDALTGGGGIGNAVRAFANEITRSLFDVKNGPLGSITTGLVDAVTSGLSFLGKTASSIVGNIAGSILPGLGGLITGIGALFKKVFHSAEQDVNPVRQAFVDAAGGLDALNKKAVAAGVSLTKMLDAKNPEQYTKAINELNAALQFQDQSMQFLDDTIKKYGFSISELGPTLAKQKLGEQAAQIEKEWYALNAAGVDINQVSIKMGSSISTWLQQALAAGTQIPDSMREILHQLAAVGLLTDASGNKYDLAKIDALDYAKTTEGAMAGLQKAIESLTDAITRGLGGALKGLPKNVDVNINTHTTEAPAGTGPGGLPAGAARGGIVLPFGRGVRAFGRGGLVGSDSELIAATPGELLLTAAQQGRLASRMGGTTIINVTVQGSVIAERDLQRVVQRQADSTLRLRRKLGAA